MNDILLTDRHLAHAAACTNRDLVMRDPDSAHGAAYLRFSLQVAAGLDLAPALVVLAATLEQLGSGNYDEDAASDADLLRVMRALAAYGEPGLHGTPALVYARSLLPLTGWTVERCGKSGVLLVGLAPIQ